MKCGAFYCDSKRVSKGEKSNEGQEICIVHAIIGFRGYRQDTSLLVVVVIPAPVGFLRTSAVIEYCWYCRSGQ